MNLTPLAILHIKASVPLIKLQFNDLKEVIDIHVPKSMVVAHGTQIYIKHPLLQAPHHSNSSSSY